MNRVEKNKIIKFANLLSDEELEKEYYQSVFDCLGSEVDDMYELGYDICDITEREKHEKYLLEYSDLLEHLCLDRGIRLFEDYFEHKDDKISSDEDLPFL